MIDDKDQIQMIELGKNMRLELNTLADLAENWLGIKNETAIKNAEKVIS